MNIKQIETKQRQLLKCYMDIFSLVKATVKSMQDGKTKLSGTLLRELNAFLKQASETLDKAKVMEEMKIEQEKQENDYQSIIDEIPSFSDVGLQDLQGR